MNFPESISLTITNYCNLRCQMCGQWSEEGYIKQNGSRQNLKLEKWKSIIDELVEHNTRSVLLRASKSKFLNHQTAHRRFIKKAVKKFMPGELPSDALDATSQFGAVTNGGKLERFSEVCSD